MFFLKKMAFPKGAFMVDLCLKNLSKKLIALGKGETTKKHFSKSKVDKFILDILSIVFPVRGFKEELNVNNLSLVLEKKRLVLSSFLNKLNFKEDETLINKFFSYLPDLKIKLKKDALFILEEDPAANSIDEVITIDRQTREYVKKAVLWV